MKRRISLLALVLLIAAAGLMTPLDAAPKLKRQNVKGTVTRITGQIAHVQISPSRTVAVQLGPQSYWEYRGCRLAPGQVVTVNAWNDPGDDNFFFAGSLSGSGFSIVLTNDAGFPVWVTEESYHAGWYPTREAFVSYYHPTYRFVPPGQAKGARPGHAKRAPSGHAAKQPSPERAERQVRGPRGR